MGAAADAVAPIENDSRKAPGRVEERFYFFFDFLDFLFFLSSFFFDLFFAISAPPRLVNG